MGRKKKPLVLQKRKRNKKSVLKKELEDLRSKFKLKELRIILHDIAANNIILPYQKPFINKNIDSINVIDKCDQYTNNEIDPKEKKCLVNNILETKCSNVKSTKIKKQKNVNDNVKEEEYEVINENECITKHENIDLSIDATNDNGDLCPDLLNQTVPVPDIDTKNQREKQDLNSDENFQETFITNAHSIENKCSTIQTGKKSPEVTQVMLKTQECTDKAYVRHSILKKDLPKIREDNILPENTVIILPKKHKKKKNVQRSVVNKNPWEIKEDNVLPKDTVALSKIQNDVRIPNNSQDMAYSTDAVLRKRNNECFLAEASNRVIQLTVENLYKFTENYNNCSVASENNVSLNTKKSCQNSTNDNNIDRIVGMNDNDQYVYSRKRNWFIQEEQTKLNKTGIKRIKLNRKRIHEKDCAATNDSLCLSYDNTSNLSSKCNNINISNNMTQDMDNHLTLYSNNGNTLCNIQFVQESTKADSDVILRSTHAVEKNISSSSHTILDEENKKNELSPKKCALDTENINQNDLNENKTLSCSDQLDHSKNVTSETHDDFNDNNDDDDDYISLFTDSFISLDEITVPSNNNAPILPVDVAENEQNNTYQDYKMAGNTLNKYLQQNIFECNKALNTVEEHDISKNESYQQSYRERYKDIPQNSICPIEKISINVENISSVNSNVVNNNNSLCSDKNCNKYRGDIACCNETAVTYTAIMEPMKCEKLCNGYCFLTLRRGNCKRTQCPFDHDLQTLIRNIFKYKKYLTSIIDYTFSMKYHCLVRHLYLQSLHECNVAFIMDIYQKLYSRQLAYSDIVYATIQALLKKGMNVKDVVDSLCKILTPTDDLTPNHILNSIRGKIKVGEYWNTLGNLLIYIKPRKEVIESILTDCLITHKHVQDVYENLIQQLNPEERNELNRDIMLSFNNLLAHEYQKCSVDISPKPVFNNEESCAESYVIHSISDLPEPHSQYRNRFWKIYLMLHNIKEGLSHEDYDYVVSILDAYEEKNEDESLFSRCCFRMLCAEIKHSEYHISKIIEHAVHIGASNILYKVLLDVATYVLMKLITEEDWILAYKLLKNLQTYNFQHSAAFVILSAEIYLANKHAVKALMLLKKSNIISLNRNKWNVISNEEDYHPRTNLMRILLDVLCIESSEHAFFMFQFLVKDQASNFQPIDLTHYVDKLMLKFLIDREIELIIRMGYMIIEYNFTFFNTTIYRAVIATLVHSDMILAKQLYQYASGLGIYNTIKILPVTSVIINTDWVEEEIYLTFFDLFQRLVMDIGHSIDRFNPTHLSIYVIFETVPTEAQLYYENFDDQQKKKVNSSKNLVRQVLFTRFEPPIPLSKKVNGTILKLQNKAVIDHLKAICKHYI